MDPEQSENHYQNLLSDEPAQSLTSDISYQYGVFPQSGASSLTGPSVDVSHSDVQMAWRSPEVSPGSINNRGEGKANSSNGVDERSFTTDDVNSFLCEGSFSASISRSCEILAPNYATTFGCSSRGDHFSAQQPNYLAHQTQTHSGMSQGEQQFMVPAHQSPGPYVRTFKKPRMETTQQYAFHPQPVQQLPQTQNPLQQGYGYEEAVATFYQQQPQIQYCNSLSQPLYQPLREIPSQMLPPQALSQDTLTLAAASASTENDICVLRLMQYMHHQSCRPADNSLEYWKKLVNEYFSPRARKKWCLSKYNVAGRHASDAISQTPKDVCDFCRSSSGKGFVVTFQLLPALLRSYFESGVIDELLYLDVPERRKLQSGLIILWFEKAVIQSVYKNFRVVHEGQLSVVFTQDLKIMSWEFCLQRHEELISRTLLATQVNKFAEDAARCQPDPDANTTSQVKTQDLRKNCHRLATAGHELARTLELPLVNDLGFSKTFVRHLQLHGVINSMSDLMRDSQTNKLGPIENLKRYNPQECANPKIMTGIRDARAQMYHTQGPPARNQPIAVDASLHHQNPVTTQLMNCRASSSLTPVPPQSSSEKTAPNPVPGKISSLPPIRFRFSEHDHALDKRVVTELLEGVRQKRLKVEIKEESREAGKKKAKRVYKKKTKYVHEPTTESPHTKVTNPASSSITAEKQLITPDDMLDSNSVEEFAGKDDKLTSAVLNDGN